MASTTIFKGFSQPVEDKALMIMIKYIREGKYKEEVEKIRHLINNGDFDQADQLKKQLPAFTPSGTYEGGRKAELLKMYSGYVHLDFDKLNPDQLSEIFQKISEIPYTFACLRSPSGNGLKVFVQVTTSAVEHETAYKQVQDFYEKELGILADPKCKDITRLCFVSYDPDLYLNIQSQKFKVIVDTKPASENKSSPILGEDIGGGQKSSHEKDSVEGLAPNIQDSPDDFVFQNLFTQCLQFTEQKESYHQGNRNNFIYLLSCNCNRAGIPEENALELIGKQFDLSPNEIKSSVKSAYQHHKAEFANFAEFAKLQPVEDDNLQNTPTIPVSVYEKLPELLKSGAMVFSDLREKDVFLTSSLSILSGCLPNTKGVYDNQTVFPNLFSFVIAPAASGKGSMKFSKALADKYHDEVLNRSKEVHKDYTREMNDHKLRQRMKKRGESSDEPPEEPVFKVVFIPANSSYSKMIYHLEQNGEEGIICETEADTMGNVLKQDWGSYSDMLRKAFHHEHISSSKKNNNEYIQVKEPRLSVTLSGTPSQVTSLIESAEDGLFSRFLFYVYKVPQQWRDVSPSANKVNLTDHFANLSDRVYKMVEFLNSYPTEFDLSQDQWDALNYACTCWLSDVSLFVGDNAGSVVKRLGLIWFRIAMILSVLDKFNSNDKSVKIICSYDNFESALNLTKIYLHHSLLMFQNLPSHSEHSEFRSYDNKMKFYEALPETFKRSDAVELGKSFGMESRTVDYFLKKALGTKLTQDKPGFYSKLPPF
jgi:hypothetical protein